MKSALIFFFTLLLSGSVFAHNPGNSDPSKSDRLKSQLNRHVVFPTSAPVYGEVDVVLQVNPLGEVEVLQSRSLNEQLSDYVAKKLEKVRLTKDDISLGQVIRYRFVFKKQD